VHGVACVRERTMVVRSRTCAVRGSSIHRPNAGNRLGSFPVPANVDGASGLGSNVSSWLGEPNRYSKMHDLARPTRCRDLLVRRRAASRRKYWLRLRPSAP